jgi:hypothetical protein
MKRLAPGVLWLNDSPGSGGIWGDEIDRANAAAIVAAHNLLRFVTDPKSEEVLADLLEEVTAGIWVSTDAAHAILERIAQAMGGE